MEYNSSFLISVAASRVSTEAARVVSKSDRASRQGSCVWKVLTLRIKCDMYGVYGLVISDSTCGFLALCEICSHTPGSGFEARQSAGTWLCICNDVNQ